MAAGEVGSRRLDLRRRRLIIGDRNPRGRRPNEVEGEVTREVGTDVEADRAADGGGRTAGDLCLECKDPRLGSGTVDTNRRCDCSVSDSDEELVSSCCVAPLDCDAFMCVRETPMGGTAHSTKCEGRVSILVGRGPASNTT